MAYKMYQLLDLTAFRKLLDPIEVNLLNNLRHIEKSDCSGFMDEYVPRE
jgi:hypothetical protein